MKKLIIIGILLALCAGGLWLARPAYRNWQQERFVSTAQKALDQDDLKAATLNAQQALTVNPSNVQACRIMAVITERLRSPVALQWRQKLVTLEPQSISNRLDLARCSLTFGDYVAAAQALQGIAVTNRNSGPFHHLAAIVAVGLQDLPKAVVHFKEAARFEPTNPVVQLNLAVIQLQATDTSVVAQAVQSLEQLRANPKYGIDALRTLVMTATRAKDFDRAVVLSGELQSKPDSSMGDHLLYLGALRDAKHPDFNSELARMQTVVSTNAASVNQLAGWLIGQDMADDAARWLDGLPEPMKGKRPVTLARADAYMALNDWPEMQSALQEQQWDDVDFLRLAMLSRACREQNQDFAAQKEWIAAVQSVSDRPRAMTALASLAGSWGWAKEQEDLLWAIATKFPSERSVLQSLEEIYTRSGNTPGLQKVFLLVANYNPDDVVAKNNFAAISLLLNVQLPRSVEFATEAYTRYPSNASFASTMAYALHVQGKSADGLAIMEALKPAQLEQPSIALYYGVLLSAMETPDKAKAAKYLAIASRARLFPEERTLLEEARKRL